MKYDLSNITFCVFCRVDNEERQQNLKAMVSFYRRYGDNVQFIISEDGLEPKVPQLIELTENDVYTFQYNPTEWKKCEGYNKCIKLAKTNTLVFNDVDAIIHPLQILEAHQQLSENPACGLIYPFNGLFLCTDSDLKQKFIQSNCDYDTLDNKFPEQLLDYDGNVGENLELYHQHVNKTYNNVLVGHVHSKGGCVTGRRDNIIKCNGYNPLFKGWGYEDDEFPVRINSLGYDVGRLSGIRKPCWHLHHYDGTGSKKEHQEFYEHNRQVVSYVESVQHDQPALREYIKNWRL